MSLRAHPSRKRRLALLAAAFLVAVGAATPLACGGTSATVGSAAGAIVAVTERDFHITAPAHLSAGAVDLRVHNEGPDQHELIVVPAGGGPGVLPLRKDGLTIDEEAVESSEPGSLPPGEPGSTRELRLTLQPGRYLFFCNMEGHFMGGMHTEVVVAR